MMNPLPSVSKAYAMIMADESQRTTAGTHTGKETLDPVALYAGKGHPQRNPRNSQQKKKDWDQICDYCKVQGHVKLNCYRLNGYPPDWKFKKRFGPGVDQGGSGQMQGTHTNDKQQQSMANQVRHDPTPSMDAFAPVYNKGESSTLPAHLTFTQGQYQRLLHILDREGAETLEEPMANMAMAGMTSPSNSAFSVNDKTGSWIIDSGATCHMTSKLERLNSSK